MTSSLGLLWAIRDEISYESEGAPVAKVVAALRPSAKVDPTIAGRPLIVRFSSVARQDALDRIATALDATWVEVGGRATLTRTRANLRDMDLREQAFRMARLKPSYDAIQNQSASVITTEDARELANATIDLLELYKPASERRKLSESRSAEAMKAIQMDSLTNLAKGVMGSIPLSELAKIAPGARVVWALSPNRLQRPLPGRAEIPLRRLADSIERLSKALFAAGWSKIEKTQAGKMFLLDSEGVLETAVRRPEGAPVVIASRQTVDAGVSMQICHVGPDGGAHDLAPRVTLATTDPATKPFVTETISAHPTVAKLAANRARPPRHVLTKSEWRDLIDGESFDPQALVVGHFLVELAKARRESLVASPADWNRLSWINPSVLARPGTMSLALTTVHEITEANGWLILRPGYASDERRSVISRVAIRNALRSLEPTRLPTIEQLAGFYADGLSRYNVGGALLSIAFDQKVNSVRPIRRIDDETMIQLFASMSPEQRRLATARGLPLRGLDSRQRAMVESLVFGASQRLEIMGPHTQTDGVSVEPTSCFPEGIPELGVLHVSTTFEPIVSATHGDDAEIDLPNIETAEFIAYREKMAGQEDAPGYDYDKLYVGSQRNIRIQIDLGRGLGLTAELHDATLDPARTVSRNDLPAEFRQEIDRKRAEINRSSAARRQSQP